MASVEGLRCVVSLGVESAAGSERSKRTPRERGSEKRSAQVDATGRTAMGWAGDGAGRRAASRAARQRRRRRARRSASRRSAASAASRAPMSRSALSAGRAPRGSARSATGTDSRTRAVEPPRPGSAARTKETKSPPGPTISKGFAATSMTARPSSPATAALAASSPHASAPPCCPASAALVRAGHTSDSAYRANALRVSHPLGFTQSLFGKTTLSDSRNQVSFRKRIGSYNNEHQTTIRKGMGVSSVESLGVGGPSIPGGKPPECHFPNGSGHSSSQAVAVALEDALEFERGGLGEEGVHGEAGGAGEVVEGEG